MINIAPLDLISTLIAYDRVTKNTDNKYVIAPSKEGAHKYKIVKKNSWLVYYIKTLFGRRPYQKDIKDRLVTHMMHDLLSNDPIGKWDSRTIDQALLVMEVFSKKIKNPQLLLAFSRRCATRKEELAMEVLKKMRNKRKKNTSSTIRIPSKASLEKKGSKIKRAISRSLERKLSDRVASTTSSKGASSMDYLSPSNLCFESSRAPSVESLSTTNSYFDAGVNPFI